MRGSRGRAVRSASILFLSAVLVACGSPVTGSAQRGADTAVATTGESVSDTAAPPSAPTSLEPLTPVGENDVLRGRRLEARRVANHMPLVSEVDPALAIMDFPTHQITDDLSEVLTAEQVQFVQHTGGLELGFVASRKSTEDDAALVIMVLEFATAEQAATTAAELPAIGDEKEPLTSTVPQAVAGRLLFPEVAEVEVSVSADTLLYYARAVTWKDTDGLPLGDKAVQTLVTTMADFRVTKPDARLALPADVDSLAAHTLPNQDRGSAPVHTAHAALHFQYEQVSAAQVFANAGVDVAALGEVSVYRTADGPRAALLQAHFLSESAINGDFREAPIEDLPDSTSCTADASGALTCAGTVGRFTFKFLPEDPEAAVDLARRQQNLLEQL